MLWALILNQVVEFFTELACAPWGHVIAAAGRKVRSRVKLEFWVFPGVVIFDKDILYLEIRGGSIIKLKPADVR